LWIHKHYWQVMCMLCDLQWSIFSSWCHMLSRSCLLRYYIYDLLYLVYVNRIINSISTLQLSQQPSFMSFLCVFYCFIGGTFDWWYCDVRLLSVSVWRQLNGFCSIMWSKVVEPFSYLCAIFIIYNLQLTVSSVVVSDDRKLFCAFRICCQKTSVHCWAVLTSPRQ